MCTDKILKGNLVGCFFYAIIFEKQYTSFLLLSLASRAIADLNFPISKSSPVDFQAWGRD